MEELHVVVVLLKEQVKNLAVLLCELAVAELYVCDCLAINV